MTAGQRVKLDWMGHRIETLADLLRPRLKAICIGINPAPISVAAGHYYQGNLGQRFFSRLVTAGLLGGDSDQWEDDAAFAKGIGFTDVVKRPTASASQILPEEYTYGRARVVKGIQRHRPKLLIFSFKRAAEAILGTVYGNGLITGQHIAEVPVFVMPGPYERSATVERVLKDLVKLVRTPR